MDPIELKSNGAAGFVLLAACADTEGGGGVYSFDGATVQRLDALNTSSLAVAGERLARLRWSEPGDASGLFVYDRWGVQRYCRLDGLGDAHQAAWDGENFVIASTATNSIVWLSPSGGMREWRAPGVGDAWHLNGLFLRDGEVYVTAFGRFTAPREWNAHRSDGSGILFRARSGESIITGLNCPHHARYLDGAWLVCSAADHELLEIEEATGKVLRRIRLGGWTRGLAWTDDYLFAGVSAPRHDPGSAGEKAGIAVISRAGWSVAGYVPLGGREVGDLALAPAALVEGLRRGLAVERVGFESSGFVPGLMPAMPPLAAGEVCLAPLRAPSCVEANGAFTCVVKLANRSGYALQSFPPHPVCLSYHWADDRGGQVVFDGLRTELAPPLLRDESREYTMNVRAPERPGRYRLRLTLVQELVRWFDEPPTALLADLDVEVR